jgi:hypothetical protein
LYAANISTTRKYDVIPLLISIAQAAVKEKVIRVIVATFRVEFLVSDITCITLLRVDFPEPGCEGSFR